MWISFLTVSEVKSHHQFNTRNARKFLCRGILNPEGGGVLSKKLGGGVRSASQNAFPIYYQNLRFSLSYLWPDQKFDTLFMVWPLNGGKMVKIDPLLWPKRLKTIAFGAAHIYIAHTREYLPYISLSSTFWSDWRKSSGIQAGSIGKHLVLCFHFVFKQDLLLKNLNRLKG